MAAILFLAFVVSAGSGLASTSGGSTRRSLAQSEVMGLHDLRRTVATGMADRLAIAPHIIEAILNHAERHKRGVAGIYNRATYLAEKKQALERWGDYVMALIEGRDVNVVPMQRSK